jgi:molybdate transport system substrate-binding protein
MSEPCARSVTKGVSLLIAVLALCMAAPYARSQSVTVFAAASLRNALDEVDAFNRKKGGPKVVVSYASSSALAKQVENGAPADIFISADLDWMDYLEKRNLIKAASRTNLLRNELVIVAPAGTNVSFKIGPRFPLAAQLGTGRLAMGDPDHVPAGKYGRAALEALGVWQSVADRIARAENVRSALLFVSRGEAPLGIVYRTDALADKKVRIVGAFPADSHPPIVYPAAILAGRQGAAAAGEFFAVLQSPQAAAIFKAHGFVPY